MVWRDEGYGVERWRVKGSGGERWRDKGPLKTSHTHNNKDLSCLW